MTAVITAGLLVVMGMGLSMLGSVKLALARRAEMTDSQIGWLATTFGLLTIPVPPVAGWFNDHFGRSPVGLLGCVGLTLGLLMMQRARCFRQAVGAMAVFTVGWATISNVANSLISRAFSASEIQSIAMGNVLFALGAWMTPTLMALLLERLGFVRTLSVLVAAVLGITGLLGGLWVFVPHLALPHVPHLPPDQANPLASPGQLMLADVFLWWSALALAAYGVVESVTSTWTTSAQQERGDSETQAERALSGYFFAFLLGRVLLVLLGPALSPQIWPTLAMSLLMLGVMGWTLSPSAWIARQSLKLLGAGVGVAFPSMLTLFLNSYPEHQHGRALGWLFSLAAVAWCFLPLVYAGLCDRLGVVRGLRWLILPALLLLLLALLGPFSPLESAHWFGRP